ncbi:ABC transporter permease, partial [Synergistaceae bacterium OttesenSCG-928-I11]|nr:ABC transporter permease [Synergistaceae bacterium OttesenSCG-928-I11]
MIDVRRVGTLVWKESLEIVRDPSSIFIAFVLPLILLLFFGYGVSLDLKEIKFGIALEDGGAEARRLALEFEGSPNFAPTMNADRRALLHGVATGEVKGALVIPHGFSAAIHARTSAKPPTIQIVTDGTMPNTATMVQNYALGVVRTWMASLAGSSGGVEIVSRVWYNEQMESRFFIIPALIVTVMSMIGTMLTALVVAREWERGTMEAMLSTPINRYEVLLGKLIPYYGLAILSTFFCVFFSTFFFGIPFRGSLLMLFCVGSVFMLSALSIGLVISNVTKNQYAASIGALMLSFLPTVLLSGGVFEISSMPAFQRAVSAILPGKYLVRCLLTLFLVGDVTELLLPNMAVLAFMGALGIAATLAFTSSRLA